MSVTTDISAARGREGYDRAVAAIKAGTARPKKLWILIRTEHDRDGLALRPTPFEGPGEYQHVDFDGEYFGLVRLPENARRLTDIAAERAKAHP